MASAVYPPSWATRFMIDVAAREHDHHRARAGRTLPASSAASPATGPPGSTTALAR